MITPHWPKRWALLFPSRRSRASAPLAMTPRMLATTPCLLRWTLAPATIPPLKAIRLLPTVFRNSVSRSFRFIRLPVARIPLLTPRSPHLLTSSSRRILAKG